MDEEQVPKASKLFDKGCTIPNVKSLTFNKSDGIKLNCFYEPAVPGFPNQLAYFQVPPCNPKEEVFSVKVRVKLNKNGIVVLQDVSMNEEFTVEEKVEKKKVAPPPSPKKE